MMQGDFSRGRTELRAAQLDQRGLLWAVAAFSIVVNLLQLTGSFYMLQIYDRVLVSRSEPTLVAISVLTAFLYLALGVLDHARARIMAKIGAKMQQRMDRRVFAAALRQLNLWPNDQPALAAQRDLEALQRLWASPVLLAVFDIPWIPLFFLALWAFHPDLAVLALGGAAMLIALTYLNQRMTRPALAIANIQGMAAGRLADHLKSEAETVQGLGMATAGFDRWQKARTDALVAAIEADNQGGLYSNLSRVFRMLLQSAMLGLGAWLVIRGELSAGAMIAASILLGRALAPIEQAIGQWSTVTRAQQGWVRLVQLLTNMPEASPKTKFPRPKAELSVQYLTVIAPNASQPALRSVSFDLAPGQALAVLGPSGAGKSSLARAITNLWRPANGKIRLAGATLDQYDPETLGGYIGYLPQRITLFDGSIAENIARLDANAKPEAIFAAAKRAAAHEMILQLPEGYDTQISQNGGRLSGGQMQRIGLARALYGDPVLLVLDEPNSNLDHEGDLALTQAIRTTKAAGGAVLVMAHRPAALQECDFVLILEDGIRRAFGPRDAVLREAIKNHAQFLQPTAVRDAS
jgi:ATP-binding cassette, subfamily C, bacterial